MKKLMLVLLAILALVYGAKPPYPIIFVHGLNSNDLAFQETMNYLNSGDYYWGTPNVYDVILNFDNDIHSSLLADDVKYQNSVFEGRTINLGRRGSWSEDSYIFAINFDEERVEEYDGDFGYSNQAAIYKQGYALSRMITEVTNFTGSDKVILVGHSMGGLAIREYLQRVENSNRIWWSGDHKVARVTTIGTPHLGSNAWYNDPTKEWPQNESEALRDLKYSYESGYPGVYLFGGNEQNLSGFWCTDVNCDDILTNTIVGINSGTTYNLNQSLPTNIKYTWIVSDINRGEDYYLDNRPGDGCVLAFRQWLYSGSVPEPINITDTLMTLKRHADFPFSSEEYGIEGSDYKSIIRGIDEPNIESLAYKIAESKVYNGIITMQSSRISTDKDLFYFDNSGINSKINILLQGATSGVTKFRVYNDDGTIILDQNTNLSSDLNINDLHIGQSNKVYFEVTGTATNTSWEHPYRIIFTRQEVDNSITLTPSLDNTTYQPSSSAKLTVNLTDSDGNPVSGAAISMSIDGGSSLNLSESTPAGTYVRWFVTPSSTGIYNIAMTATKSGYEVGTSSIDLNVQTAGIEGHDLAISNHSINAGSPGASIRVDVNIWNKGIYTETNVPVRFYLYDPSNNLIDTDLLTITSIGPTVLLADLPTIYLQTTSTEGYYKVKIFVELGTDYDQSNNLLEIATWVGGDLDFEVYKTDLLYFENVGEKITFGNHSVELVTAGTTAIRVNIYRGSTEIVHEEILKIEGPEIFDNEQLLLVYDTYSSYTGGYYIIFYMGEGVDDPNNIITPTTKTIDLGGKAVYRVYTTDTKNAEIDFPKWDANSSDAGATIDSWSWSDTNYSADDTDYDFIITPPTSATIKSYRFWTEFCYQDGCSYFQKLTLDIHAPHNIEVTNVLTPTEIHLGETLDLKSIIKNSGGYEESSIQVQCKLTDNSSNEIIVNQMNSLAINAVDTMDFSMNVANIPAGNYSLVVTANINNDLFPANNTMTKTVTVLPMKELITTPLIKEQDICIGEFLEIEHEVRDENSDIIGNAQVYAKLQQDATMIDAFTCEYDSVLSRYVASRRLQNSGEMNLIVTSTYEGYAVSSDTLNFYSMSVPYDLTATVNEDDITLDWKFNETTKKLHDGYKIYRNYEWLTDINDPAQHQYIDQDLSYGKYVYQVSAVFSDSISESLLSDSLIVRIDGQIVINSLQPEPGTVIIDETDSLNFSIESYDPDGNLLEYRWKVDNVTIGYDNALILYSDYYSHSGIISAGEYVLTLDVTDNFQSKNSLTYTWNVTVNDINRSPEIVSYLPSEQNIDVRNDIPDLEFEISVADPDIDNTLTYRWLINSTDQNINDSLFNKTFTNEGTFEIKAVVTDGIAADSIMWNITSYVGIEEINIPKATQLHQNYPNPFNPETTVTYDIAQAGQVSINVLNYKGELVSSLVNGNKSVGRYSVKWNCSDSKDQTVTSGMYFIVMQTANYSKVVKALMVK